LPITTEALKASSHSAFSLLCPSDKRRGRSMSLPSRSLSLKPPQALYNTVVKHLKKDLNILKILIKLTLILVCGISYGQTEIIGKVISGISGEKPISDIYVQELITKQPLIMADSLGNFRIEYLEPNKKYVIEISAFGYGKQKFDVQTKSGINNVAFELKADCEYNAERAEFDWKNGKANLLLVGSIAPIANSPSDKQFEEKFGIKYFDFGCEPLIDECLKEYNKRVFELIDKKYGMKWRKKVRSDVEYLK